jgi:hypothetical protein
MAGALRTSPVIVALLAASCSGESEGPALPPPVAALSHPEVVRVGAVALFDARGTAVAKGQPGQPGAIISRFRFQVADGTAAVEGNLPEYSRVFAEAGSFAVAVTATDDRGFASTATSVIHVVASYAPYCEAGGALLCPSQTCAGDACAVLACAGTPACPPGKGLTCKGGLCVDPDHPTGGSRMGADAGSRVIGPDSSQD